MSNLLACALTALATDLTDSLRRDYNQQSDAGNTTRRGATLSERLERITPLALSPSLVPDTTVVNPMDASAAVCEGLCRDALQAILIRHLKYHASPAAKTRLTALARAAGLSSLASLVAAARNHYPLSVDRTWAPLLGSTDADAIGWLLDQAGCRAAPLLYADRPTRALLSFELNNDSVITATPPPLALFSICLNAPMALRQTTTTLESLVIPRHTESLAAASLTKYFTRKEERAERAARRGTKRAAPPAADLDEAAAEATAETLADVASADDADGAEHEAEEYADWDQVEQELGDFGTATTTTTTLVVAPPPPPPPPTADTLVPGLLASDTVVVVTLWGFYEHTQPPAPLSAADNHTPMLLTVLPPSDVCMVPLLLGSGDQFMRHWIHPQPTTTTPPTDEGGVAPTASAADAIVQVRQQLQTFPQLSVDAQFATLACATRSDGLAAAMRLQDAAERDPDDVLRATAALNAPTTEALLARCFLCMSVSQDSRLTDWLIDAEGALTKMRSDTSDTLAATDSRIQTAALIRQCATRRHHVVVAERRAAPFVHLPDLLDHLAEQLRRHIISVV